jgi:pilus assembly protein Flp/PilA
MTRRLLRDQRGQGMTEYIIIVALVAIAAIGVVGIFGDDVRQMLGVSTDATSGEATAETGASGPANSNGDKSVTTFAGAGNTSPPAVAQP